MKSCVFTVQYDNHRDTVANFIAQLHTADTYICFFPHSFSKELLSIDCFLENRDEKTIKHHLYHLYHEEPTF